MLVSACVVCQDRDSEERSQACSRCAGRLAGALRQIPKLVDELRGLGYVERDVRPGTRAVREGAEIVRVPAMADPVANLWPAGPMAGASTGPRAGGTRERSLPIRVDPTDLLARPRHGSLLVAGRSPWPDDQVGHLGAAAVLDFWVRDWADLRGEGLPPLQAAGERSPAGLLARWLADRLDWALREHPALDEFAGDVSRLLGALWGLAGHGTARPKLMEAECPSCGLLALTQPFPEAYIECDCGRCLTPDEYEEYVMDMRHEVTAQDVLTVLNGLERPKLDGLTFAVITKGYTESPGQGRAAGKLIKHEEIFSPFERGEIVVLNGNGREPFGEGRKPGKWSVEYEEFLTLDGALNCREQLLKPCPTCSGPTRETVGMVCQTCGTDYAAGSS